jgi:hypothetical protein
MYAYHPDPSREHLVLHAQCHREALCLGTTHPPLVFCMPYDEGLRRPARRNTHNTQTGLAAERNLHVQDAATRHRAG